MFIDAKHLDNTSYNMPLNIFFSIHIVKSSDFEISYKKKYH